MKYCKEITEKICKSIEQLKGRVGAVEEAGISYETFTEWMKKTEFSEAIKKAEEKSRQKGKEIAIMSIFRAMPIHWQAGAWWLERNFEEYLQKNKTDLSSMGEKIQTGVIILPSKE